MSHANVPLVVGVVFDDGSFLLDWLHGCGIEEIGCRSEGCGNTAGRTMGPR